MVILDQTYYCVMTANPIGFYLFSGMVTRVDVLPSNKRWLLAAGACRQNKMGFGVKWKSDKAKMELQHALLFSNIFHLEESSLTYI